MRWSSSTTRMCAALSGSVSMLTHFGLSLAAACGDGFDRPGQQRFDQRALLPGDHVEQEASRHTIAADTRVGQGLSHALGLQGIEASGEGYSLLGGMQPPLATIALAGLLHDPPLIHELLED